MTPRDPAWARTAPARVVRALLQVVLLQPVVRFLTPVATTGRDRVRRVGPAVYVANHQSHVDTPVCLVALGRQVRRRLVVAAAADYFYRSRLTGAAVSLLLGTVPFVRAGSSRESLDQLKRLVGEGWSVLLFPSGTRGPMTAVLPGFAYVAVDARVPVVPVHLSGPEQVMPKGSHLPLPGGISVTIGDPIEPGNDYAALVERVTAAFAAMSG